MSNFNLEKFAKTAENIRKRAIKEGRLIDNPSDKELENFLLREPEVTRTRYGNFVANSEPTSRAAMFTKNSVDFNFGPEEEKLLIHCESNLAKEKLISIDRMVGDKNSPRSVRLVVPTRFAHVAYGGKNIFLAPEGKIEKPTYEIIMFFDEQFERNKTKKLPEKDITVRLAMMNDGRIIKIVRNSNYIGEYKKGVFAAEDWTAKTKRSAIFLHAGCREDYLQSVHGNYDTVRSLLVALSANGKTTTTCKILARKGNEKSWLIQDDGGTFLPDGSFEGFEAGGVYAKTERVNAGEQIEIFYGLLKKETLFENVYVDNRGDFDFYNLENTSNGRAVIRRKDIMHASSNIEVEKIDNIILITRGPLIPAISKLTLEQTAALMILGQAMESSAGDPTKAGKIRSEFFYDPFMAGDKAEHANLFYSIVKNLPNLNCYLINTGGIGEDNNYKDIKLEHTLGVLDSLLRGGLEDWVESPTGFKVPRAIRSLDDIYLHPEKLYHKAVFNEKEKELNKTRKDAIDKVEGNLHPDIRNCFKQL